MWYHSNRSEYKTSFSLSLLSLLLIFGPAAFGQEASDVFLVDAKKNILGFKVFSASIEQVTDSKRYDNQPKFINDSQLVFSSEDDTGNVEAILYSWEKKQFTNMTRTPDKSEFSPDLTSCGQYISTVTVEEDSSQRVWLYPINFGEPELLYDDIQPVGYYGWHEETAALFVIGEPNRLVFPYGREDIHTIAQNTGRSIQKRPGTDEIIFLDKNNNIVVDGKTTFELKAFHTETREITSLGLALGGSEDFCWVDKNNILMARGKELFLRKVNKGIEWEKVGTFTIPGYGDISRLSISPDTKKIAIVLERHD
ncbi:hypothetical protein [Cyclobacterium roseum]|uniref:hypothetical protein n=1 Tax=Cyclobacterium roseum TaxID=2666137 RepID=UPI001F28F504|nr:hypothetical protein [Cyclobacterium roseum]